MSFQITDQTACLSRRKIVTVFITCAAVDLASLIDQNALAVALPRISSALGSGDQISWIVVAYFITATSFQLLYSSLSNIWSRKLVLLAGLGIFFTGSLAASFVTNITQLIIFRAFTGIGGGGLITLVQIIVGDVVSLRERGKWQGILGAVVALSHGVGPIIGGKIISYSADSWRWIFRLNLFTSAFTTLMVLFFMPLKKVEGHWKAKLKSIDFFGAALNLSGSILLILGLSWGGVNFSWLSLRIIFTLSIGGILMIAFLLWQWKGAKQPILPLGIFKSRMVMGITYATFACGWNYLVQIFLIPTFYQLAYGYSPLKAASMLIPVTLVQTASSTLSGLFVTWRGRYREPLIFGYSMWALGIGLHSSLSPSSSLAMQLGYAVLTGFGAGQTFQPSLIAIQAGKASCIVSYLTSRIFIIEVNEISMHYFIRDIGGTFGLAVAGTIISKSVRDTLAQAVEKGHTNLSTVQVEMILKDPTRVIFAKNELPSTTADMIHTLVLSAYLRAFRRVFYLGTALGVSTFLVAIFFIPQVDLSNNKSEEEERQAKSNESQTNEKNSADVGV
ncbi:Efflux pump dotC [Golovinomyces cichoracearum]|uniref:Efflux pump dotC n=1 Tax=Golovinomyces cichoracearum TaxID=62708 RepID=A0A420HBU0_9PEZI|nr:Efflux pump dotC [Golovinomyces cichoracearum]